MGGKQEEADISIQKLIFLSDSKGFCLLSQKQLHCFGHTLLRLFPSLEQEGRIPPPPPRNFTPCHPPADFSHRRDRLGRRWRAPPSRVGGDCQTSTQPSFSSQQAVAKLLPQLSVAETCAPIPALSTGHPSLLSVHFSASPPPPSPPVIASDTQQHRQAHGKQVQPQRGETVIQPGSSRFHYIALPGNQKQEEAVLQCARLAGE